MAEGNQAQGGSEKGLQQQQGQESGRQRGGQDVASAADAPQKGTEGTGGTGITGETGETVFPEAHRTPAGSSERSS